MHEPGSRETALVERGSVVLVCDGSATSCSEGDCVTFDADLPHHFENPTAARPRSWRSSPRDCGGAETDAPKTMFDKIWEAHEVAADPGCSTSTCTSSTRSPARRRSTACGSPGAPCAGPTARWRPPTTTRRPTARRWPRASRTSSRACRCKRSSATARSSASRSTRSAPTRQGIVHVIGPELGVTQPGMTIVCGDSHTSTHGAFGALAFGIGTSEVEHVLATQCMVQNKPRSMRIRYEGALGFGVTAKDLILATLGQLGVGGLTGHVVEYAGPGDRGALDGGAHDRLQHDDRGRRARRHDRSRRDHIRVVHATRSAPARRRAPSSTRAIERWRELATEDGADFDSEIVDRRRARSRRRSHGARTPGWCARSPSACPRPRSSTAPPIARRPNARCTTWRSRPAPRSRRSRSTACSSARAPTRASAICAPPPRSSPGARSPPSVSAMVVPGSQQVKAQAEAEGLDRVFRAAGFDWRVAGCSMCLGMNPDILRRASAAPRPRTATSRAARAVAGARTSSRRRWPPRPPSRGASSTSGSGDERRRRPARSGSGGAGRRVPRPSARCSCRCSTCRRTSCARLLRARTRVRSRRFLDLGCGRRRDERARARVQPGSRGRARRLLRADARARR